MTSYFGLTWRCAAGSRQQGDQTDPDGGGAADGAEGQGGLHQLLERLHQLGSPRLHPDRARTPRPRGAGEGRHAEEGAPVAEDLD